MRRSVQILAGLLLSLGWWPMTSWGQEPVLDAANAFVTRWQGEAGKSIQVSLCGNYAYRWEKADGTEVKRGVATVAEGELLALPVAEAGEYVLKAGPAGVKRIVGVEGTPGALLQVVQWGSVAWESFKHAFTYCANMNIADGAGKPDLSRVKSMYCAFLDCRSFNSPIGDWDVSKVENMGGMFKECHAFNQPLEDWDVSKVENMGWMFYGCRAFNQPLEKWDVSRVTDMRHMFRWCPSFNQPLGDWDVSKVENMGQMFESCVSFNQPLGDWDVSKVENMGQMFESCVSFNQPLGAWTLSGLKRNEGWDHDLGLDGSGLDAANYSSTLVDWAAKRDQLQAGVRVRAEGLWYNTAGEAVRQQLIDGKGWVFSDDCLLAPLEPLDAANAFITRWRGKAGADIQVPLCGNYSYRWERADGTEVKAGVATVAGKELLELAVPADGEYVLKVGPAGVNWIRFRDKRSGRLRGTPEALLRVEKWGNVAWKSFVWAFSYCANMNIAYGAGKPDLSGVNSMHSAFENCSSFNSPIGDWDVSGVTDMRSMFLGCESFNQPLGGWTLSGLKRNEGRDHDLGLGGSGLDMANYSSTLVAWAAKRDQLQSGVRVRAEGLWHNATGEAARQQLMDDKGWSFSGDYLLAPIAPLDAANAFITRWQGTAGETIGVPLYGQYSYEWVRVDGGAVVASGEVRVGETHLLELAVPADGEYVLKAGPAGVKRIEFGVLGEGWYGRIRGTPGALLRVEQWGSVAWESFAGAFYGCENMGIAEGAGRPNLSGVQSMHSAFRGCASFNSPIGDWDVSRVEDMRYMFWECSSFNQPLEAWDVSQVGSMEGMFRECHAFNQPIGDWDVSKVTSMREMFRECVAFNQPLEAWDVSKVEDMRYMFQVCSSFNQPLGGWTLSALKYCSWHAIGLSLENYSSTLGGWAAKRDQLQAGVAVHAYGLKFNAAGKAARQQLIDDKGWEFAGDSEATVGSPAVEIVGAPTWLAVGATHAFTARVIPAEAPQEVTWSVEWGDWAGTFESNVLTTKREGTITVTATSEAAPTSKRSVTIRVIVPVALAGITVSPTSAQIGVGGTHRLVVRYTPADATNKDVTWSSSDEGVATVSEKGVVTAKGEGSATITAKATDGGHTATCAVMVIPPVALTSITVNPTSAQLKAGETQQLTVGYTPEDATYKHVTWSSSNRSVATVSEKGVVTAKGEGTATITATSADGGHTATCAVTVTSVPLTGITVNPTSVQLAIGGTQQLAVGYTPTDAANKDVSWSSDNEMVATVDATGVVTAKGKGSATITAQAADGGHTATCAVTVLPPVALTGITVSPTSAQLKAGETQQLTVGYTPEDATYKHVTWSSSNRSVATVSAEGIVTAKGEGSATITATSADGGHKATCAVTVTSVALTGITMSPTSAKLQANETLQLTVGYTPADATNRAVTWSSSDAGVATVDAAGVVTAKGKGSATITATSADGGHTATCAVTVVAPVPLTGITVNPTSKTLKVNEILQLTVGYTPENATNKAVSWTSSNEGVATVDAQGKVTGVKAGTATITATSADGGHTATCAVTVTAPVALTGITVSPTSAQIGVGGTQQLTVGYTPADATNRRVAWYSSDESVATVDAQGKVTGVKGGTATITATAADGGHKASCEVTVEAADTPSGVESVALAGVTVSPNPFGDALLVRGAERVVRYSLVSATGAVVLEGAHAGSDELMLATSRLPTGIYWLRLVAADGERVVQVVRR